MSQITKEEIRQFVKENGPVSRGEMLRQFDAHCECCGKEDDDLAGEIDEYRIQLLDENRITTNAEWKFEYR